MENLINVIKENGNHVVSARELHGFLEVKTGFTDWCKRMFEYGFENEVDYSLLKIGEQTGSGGHNKIDYALVLDCAKEISMLQRTDKGKQARKYFLEVEKKYKDSMLELPENYADAMRKLAEQWEQNQATLQQLQGAESKIEKDKGKVVFADAVIGSTNSVLIRQFAKNLTADGFKIGQNRLYEWLRDSKYLNIKNEPYQNYLEMGLFEVILRTVGDGNNTFTTPTTKITGKGQVYLAKKIRETYNPNGQTQFNIEDS